MPLVAACGVPVAAVADGVGLCVRNIRARCPDARVVAVKILPAGKPGDPYYDNVRRVNDAIDALKLDRDPQVRVLDVTADLTNADGTLKPAAYSNGHLHLSPAGYGILAGRLKPLIDPGPAATQAGK